MTPLVDFARPPASVAERVWFGVTLFFLGFGLPIWWFTARNDLDLVAPSSDSTSTVVFLMLFGLVYARLGGAWVHVVRAAGAVPALAFFQLVVVLSPLWSDVSAISARRVISLTMATLFGAAMYARFDRREALTLLARVLLVGAVINLAWAFVVPSVGGGENWGGVWDLKNVLGRISGLSAVVLLLAARAVPQRRVMFYGGAALSIVLVIQSNSATALVGTGSILALGAIYTAFRARRTLFGAVLTSLALGLAMTVSAATANLAWITDRLGKDITLTGRTVLWSDLVGEIASKPLLGHGYGSFWLGYFSPAHDTWVKNLWQPPNGHNIFIDLLLDLGLLGAVPFFYLVCQGVVRGTRLLRRVEGPTGLFPLIYVSFILLFSVTEAGPVGRNLLWVLLVYVLLDLGDFAHRDRWTAATPARIPLDVPAARGSFARR